MNVRSLPPMKSLVYFEAAARLQSFTAASLELNVTQGAVSRQIRLLEETLGRALFRRDRRQIRLTDDGHNYYVSVVDVLDQLANATERLSASDDPNQITLVTSSAVASLYLLPRIPEFRRSFPDIQIRIVARDNMTEGLDTDHDLALYYTRDASQAGPAMLFTEEVFPVCSPDYLEEHCDQFQSRQGLLQNLIWLESKENWINWPEWLERIGIEGSSFSNRLVVTHYSMVIQAAVAGQGIALAWKELVDPMIEQGLLVKPTSFSLQTCAGFVLTHPEDRKMQPGTQIFSDWLIDHQ